MDALTLDTMVALEHQGWDALCGQTGGPFYGSLMTEDALMVLVNGLAMDKKAVVESLNLAPGWDSYEISDTHRVALGSQAAALVYRASAQRHDEAPFEALMTSVYVIVDGAPRLALYTQTTATH